MNITLIAAMGKHREIGYQNTLLWDLPQDMQHFRTRTTNKPVIMGRKTFESIGRALPNRTNIILTRNTEWTHSDVLTHHDLDSALQCCATQGTSEVMIIGGAQIYTQALEYATHLSITHVDQSFTQADAFFPSLHWEQWQKLSCLPYASDEKHAYSFSICEYQRKS